MIQPRNIGIAAAGFGTFVNLYATQSLLPTLARAFNDSLAHTGLTVTASLVAVALVAPFVGGISDALGRRRLILGACLLLVIPTLLAAFASTITLLIACRFIQGLLLPFIFAVTVAYIADECAGPDAVRATSTYAVGTIIGGFSGRFIAGWAAELLGWQAAFLTLAAITLGAGLLIAATLPPERNFRPVQGWHGSISGFRDHFANPQVMATCLVGFTVLFSIVATFTYANFLLAAPPYGLGPAQLGSVFIVYLAGAAATPMAGRLTLRIGRRRTVWLGMATVAAGLLLTLAPAPAGHHPRHGARRHRRLHRAGAQHRLRRPGGPPGALLGRRPVCDLLLRRRRPGRRRPGRDLGSLGLAGLRGPGLAGAGHGLDGHVAGLAARQGFTIAHPTPPRPNTCKDTDPL